MDAEPLMKDSSSANQPAAAASQPKSKRPNQALYVPKKQQQGSKDKSTEGVKPRPRPRYTDKSRKNVKNRKDKAATAAAAGGTGERQDGEEEAQEAKAQVTSDPGSLAVEATPQQEVASLPEEQAAEESWDTLFDDDGDCLDPHLLEEVRGHDRSKRFQETESLHHSSDYFLLFCFVRTLILCYNIQASCDATPGKLIIQQTSSS